MERIECPRCGVSYYTEGPSMRTAVYYPPIWKDGININPDRNTTTTQCECMNCGATFYIKRCLDNVEVYTNEDK